MNVNNISQVHEKHSTRNYDDVFNGQSQKAENWAKSFLISHPIILQLGCNMDRVVGSIYLARCMLGLSTHKTYPSLGEAFKETFTVWNIAIGFLIATTTIASRTFKRSFVDINSPHF